MSALARPTGTVLGIGMMLLGIFLFATNDALGKWLVGSFSPGELLLVRSIAGLAIMAPSMRRVGAARFALAPRRGLQALRVALSAAESVLFFYALTTLPLAQVMTYYMAGPIYVTALSPWLLGERVGWRRWSAVAVGFVGVVLALHPSARTMSPQAFAALGGSFMYACFMMATRKLAGTPGTVLATAQLAAALLLGGALVVLQGWVTPGPVDFALMLVLGAGSLAGNLCVNRALHLAPASVVVPFQYTLILWGVLFGYVFFGDVLSRATLLGAAIIVGAGLFIFVREQQVKARA